MSRGAAVGAALMATASILQFGGHLLKGFWPKKSDANTDTSDLISEEELTNLIKKEQAECQRLKTEIANSEADSEMKAELLDDNYHILNMAGGLLGATGLGHVVEVLQAVQDRQKEPQHYAAA